MASVTGDHRDHVGELPSSAGETPGTGDTEAANTSAVNTNGGNTGDPNESL